MSNIIFGILKTSALTILSNKKCDASQISKEFSKGQSGKKYESM
jgi:hypothetical protein